MFQLASRVNQIEPFHVMELVKRAAAREAAGHDVVHLSIGEPDFTAIPAVVDALEQAVRAGNTQYTAAVGISALREAIAAFHESHLDARVDPARIIVTAGASGALHLACTALLNPGDEVLMADPTYPCNRHIVTATGGVPRLIPAGPEARFQLSASAVQQAWTERTAGVIVATPGNPTGTSIAPEALADIVAAVRERNGFCIVDEIYLGLSYDHPRRSAAWLGDDIILVNSFSKYFHMTGWRLGWLVVPPRLIGAFEKLAQNLVICAPAPAQHAALACFTPEGLAEFERRREAFRQRRDYLLPEFERLGLRVPVSPDGAFYIYADITAHAADSREFADRLLEQIDVCAVPGMDFGMHDVGRYMRFSYANSMERLQEAIRRMERLLLA
mgnify:CR=1 FL=1